MIKAIIFYCLFLSSTRSFIFDPKAKKCKCKLHRPLNAKKAINKLKLRLTSYVFNTPRETLYKIKTYRTKSGSSWSQFQKVFIIELKI